MLEREITDLELVELDAGASTLDPTEQVEGLRARVRRLERFQVEEFTRCRERAVEEAKRRGGPGTFNRWRNWEGIPFDYGDVCVAIVEALTQEGVKAWMGDAVSIVAQMVEAGHERAIKAEAERDEFKQGVLAVHALCDRAGVPHDLEEGQGKVVLVTELPAWKRVECLVLHWQKLATQAGTEREEALGRGDAAQVVETALRERIRELEIAIDGLVQVLTEANVGEHAWDCPANGKMEKLASCNCGHPESSQLSLKVRAVLAAAKALRK